MKQESAAQSPAHSAGQSHGATARPIQRVMAPPAFQLQGGDAEAGSETIPSAPVQRLSGSTAAGIPRSGRDTLRTGLEPMGNMSPQQLRARVPMQQRPARMAPVQKRAGKGPLQMLGVQVMHHPQQKAIITDIQISGRPERIFSGSMGDHTTAFAVHVEGIRNNILGNTYGNAFTYMAFLSAKLKELPGFKLGANLHPDRQQRLAMHVKKMDLLIDQRDGGNTVSKGKINPQTVGDSKRVEVSGGDTDKGSILMDRLQQIIHHYLEAREMIPLSTLNIRKKSALGGKGKGEGHHIAVLREFIQTKGKKHSPEAVCQAIVDLFDFSSVASVMLEPNTDLLDEMAPGTVKRIPQDNQAPQLERFSNPATLVKLTWLQHLESIKAGFPQLAGLIDKSNLRTRFDTGHRRDLIPLTGKEFEANAGDLERATTHLEKAHGEFVNDLRNKTSRNAFVKNMKNGTTGSGRAMKNYMLVQRTIERADEAAENMTLLGKTLANLKLDEKRGKRINAAMANLVGTYTKLRKNLHPWLNPAYDWDQEEIIAPDSSTYSQDPLDFKAIDIDFSVGKSWSPETGDGDGDFKSTPAKVKAPKAQAGDSAVRAARNNLGIEIQLGDDGLVSNLYSDGRSQSPFANTMGAHTIAWTLHIEQMKKRVVGKTVTAALVQLYLQAIPDLKAMEADFDSTGKAGNSTQKGRKKDLWGRIELYGATIKSGNIPEPRLAYLQEYIALILSYTNLIPGMTYKANNTDGRGEGTAKKNLFEIERVLAGCLNKVNLAVPKPWEELQRALPHLINKSFQETLVAIEKNIKALREPKGNGAVVKHQMLIIAELFPTIHKVYQIGLAGKKANAASQPSPSASSADITVK